MVTSQANVHDLWEGRSLVRQIVLIKSHEHLALLVLKYDARKCAAEEWYDSKMLHKSLKCHYMGRSCQFIRYALFIMF